MTTFTFDDDVLEGRTDRPVLGVIERRRLELGRLIKLRDNFRREGLASASQM